MDPELKTRIYYAESSIHVYMNSSLELQTCRHNLTAFFEKVSWRNAAELQSEAIVPYMDRTSVARRIQLGAVRLLQTKIAEGSDGIMTKLQYTCRNSQFTAPDYY